MRVALIILFCFVFINLNANLNYRKANRDRAGRREWNNNNYAEAERHFRENAIENPNVGQFHFNRGTALYRQENFDEAQREFLRALNDRNFSDRDKAYHNMGNIAFQTGELEQALDLYRRALLENSENIDARKNFEMTRMIMQNMAEQQPQQSDNNENEDQEQQQQQQQRQQNQNDEQQEQQRQQEQRQRELDRQEAERLLQALEQQQEQEREREQTGTGERRGRFW